MKLIKPLFYLQLFYVHRLSAPGDKRCVFEVMASAFFVAASSKQRVLTPATRRYSFCRNPLSPRCVSARFWTTVKAGAYEMGERQKVRPDLVFFGGGGCIIYA